MKYLFGLLFLIPVASGAQLQLGESVELGTITEAYEIKGDIVLTNNNSKKTFLLRADADKGVKVYTSKKTLLAGDTCLLIISFTPEKKGRFKKEIRLIASDREEPYRINLSGDLLKVKYNDQMACYYFGKRRTSPVPMKEEAVFVELPPISTPPPEPKRRPASAIGTSNTPTPARTPAPPTTPTVVADKTLLPENLYSPNNIIFLVDVSGSMQDSLKLPVVKKALHYLIDAIRDTDKLTFVTYADTIKVLAEAGSAREKANLHTVVDNLKAKGTTKGRKAIFFSQQLAQKNFIQGGNNQIIVATDGKFRFEKEDQKLWNERQGDKKIILSAVAIGDDKEAIRNLKDLSRKGDGSFIHLENKPQDKEKLIEEIKSRSKK